MSVIGKNYGKPTLDLNFAGNKSLIDTITRTNYVTFTRAQSGNEATYVGSDGLIKYASADEPRFDHDPETLESLGLLIEESRTNLLPYSQEFDNAPWGVAAASITDNTTTAPDGTMTADTLTGDGTSSTSKYISSGIDATADVFWQHTCYFKKGTNDFVQMAVGGITDIYANFNLASGTVGSYGSSTLMSPPQITKIGSNGWYRCTLSFDLTVGSSKNPVPLFALIASASASRLETNSLSTYIFLWGAQVEIGSFPTSYIPTSVSTETRSADEASITGSNFSRWYNQSEGTVFIDSSSLGLNSLNRSVYITDGSSSNSLGIVESPTFTQFLAYASGVSESSLIYNQIGLNKKAYAYKTNDAAFATDANPVLTDTSLTLPVVDRMDLNSRLGSNPLNGHISRITYWPKRLPDIELQQLTK